jgi:hypothetical protein
MSPATHHGEKNMRFPILAMGLLVISSPAFADRKAADACAAALPANSAAIYSAAVGQVGPGVDNKAIVKGIAQDMIAAGKLTMMTARGAAQAAGDCLKKLKD